MSKLDLVAVQKAKTKLPEVLLRNKKRLKVKEGFIEPKLDLDDLDDVLGDLLEDLEKNEELQLILKGFLKELVNEVDVSPFLRRIFIVVLDVIFPASYNTNMSHSILRKLRRIDKRVNQKGK